MYFHRKRSVGLKRAPGGPRPVLCWTLFSCVGESYLEIAVVNSGRGASLGSWTSLFPCM